MIPEPGEDKTEYEPSINCFCSALLLFLRTTSIHSYAATNSEMLGLPLRCQWVALPSQLDQKGYLIKSGDSADVPYPLSLPFNLWGLFRLSHDFRAGWNTRSVHLCLSRPFIFKGNCDSLTHQLFIQHLLYR